MAVSKSNKKIVLISAVVLIGLLIFAWMRDDSAPISTNQAKELTNKGAVDKAIITSDTLYLQDTKTGQRWRMPAKLAESVMIDDLVVESSSSGSILTWVMIAIGALTFMSVLAYGFLKLRATRQASMPIKNISKEDENFSNEVVAISSDVTFADVAGIEDVKVELMEIIAFLKEPLKFARFGVRMPRGLLLVGPPGVGKTMIAKAVAGEAGVPFFYQSASSFVQIYVGMGAKRVRELFMEAKRNAPSIIFIDEIDAVGKMRGAAGRNDERDATLNQLLTEMDGFDSGQGVVVIAATNKIEVLDEALLRSGRFDRRVFVEMPNLQERQAIVAKYLEKIPNAIDPLEVAKMTIGFSGATLATLINEAALKALRDDKIMLHMGDIEAVKTNVIDGKRRIQLLNETEKNYQAHYQAARAFMAHQLGYGFEKIMLMHDDISVTRPLLASREALLAEMAFALAGIAAMGHFFEGHSSSGEHDLSYAKRIASDMVKRFGMGSDLVGTPEDEKSLLADALQHATQTVQSNQARIEAIAKALLTNETLSKKAFQESLDALL
ncbi:MAG: hypothetical protein KU37_09200 [Sulfuricurvum sp. PC08-66]|nr:MAG: hypothetical protein KU37_09200 [Sulfuricurvum sp. PC08-66]